MNTRNDFNDGPLLDTDFPEKNAPLLDTDFPETDIFSDEPLFKNESITDAQEEFKDAFEATGDDFFDEEDALEQTVVYQQEIPDPNQLTSNLFEQLAKANARILELESQLEQQKQIDELTKPELLYSDRKIKNSQSKIDKLTTELRESKKKNKDSRGINGKLRKEKQEREQEITAINKLNNELQLKIEKQSEEINNNLKKIELLNQQIDDFTKRHEVDQSKNKDLKSEINMVTQEIEDLRKLNEDLLSSIKNLESELKRFKLKESPEKKSNGEIKPQKQKSSVSKIGLFSNGNSHAPTTTVVTRSKRHLDTAKKSDEKNTYDLRKRSFINGNNHNNKKQKVEQETKVNHEYGLRKRG